MTENLITAADLIQLKNEGLSPDQVCTQIGLLKSGLPPLRLNRPATPGDGIVIIPVAEQKKLVASHDAAASGGRFMKFVPASGAASRMFTNWQNVLARGGFDGATEEAEFADNLHKFAFFSELKEVVARRGENIERLLKSGNIRQILHDILTPEGLNYGRLPKALIKFHAYDRGRNRTALEEHLVEAALYTADNRKECRLHFTVSEEHLSSVARFLKEITPGYEKQFGVTFQIGLSCQSSASNTVALEGQALYRDGAGRLILRPGGHGALLENLQALDGDIVVIKNIDNVAPDRLKPLITLYKKILGGYFLGLEEEIFRHLRNLSGKNTAGECVREALLFCRQKLPGDLPAAVADATLPQQRELVIQRLNRPLRVCGIVKNEGEPGGGPFWIDDAEGGQSLQIVEAQQIDRSSGQQKGIWSAGSHFNPVDLVCGLRDYRGQKFDLPRFADPQTATLSQKTEQVRKITVLEHPGLWNGSMARWNTVFVEVPIATFNPVKTIDDLLRPQHLQDE